MPRILCGLTVIFRCWTYEGITYHMNSPTVILDVEGVFFKTRISTLTSIKGSYFDKLFEKDWKKALDRDGHLFLDRDSTIFPVILNFLRDGFSTPLPSDDYHLARILQEARFFSLSPLCDAIEKKMMYSDLPLKQLKDNNGLKYISPSTSFIKGIHDDKSVNSMLVKDRKETTLTSQRLLSMPIGLAPKPVLIDPPRRFTSDDNPPMPMKKSVLEKRLSKKSKKVESISLPRNFAHVAHVGWNGTGVIFEKHLLGEESTVRAIMDAASEADMTPIYNLISAEDEAYGSHTVEVMLAGPHMQSKCADKRDPMYTKPQKRLPKPPIKPGK